MESENEGRGKYALITGATSGFGYELSRLFATSGYSLVLVARNEARLRELAADLTRSFMVDVLIISKDLFKPTAADEISDTDLFHKAGGEDSKTYREENLSDPADVAKDGFDALMKGERRIVSGLKNKLYAGMSSIMPDSSLAKSMYQKMKPSKEEGGRQEIMHGPSRDERDEIDRSTGGVDGDYESHEDHIHTKE